MTFGLRQAMQ